ncbi:MAG: hypothetical protein D6704_12605, partial [Nitrospirae bacterium]
MSRRHFPIFFALLFATVLQVGQMGVFPTNLWAHPSAKELSARSLEACHKGRSARDRDVRLRYFRQAQALAEQALAVNDQLANSHFALFCSLGEQMRLDGEIFTSIFEFRRMMAALDRTLELNPGHLDALSAKGTFLIRLPRFLGGDP